MGASCPNFWCYIAYSLPFPTLPFLPRTWTFRVKSSVPRNARLVFARVCIKQLWQRVKLWKECILVRCELEEVLVLCLCTLFFLSLVTFRPSVTHSSRCSLGLTPFTLLTSTLSSSCSHSVLSCIGQSSVFRISRVFFTSHEFSRVKS